MAKKPHLAIAFLKGAIYHFRREGNKSRKQTIIGMDSNRTRSDSDKHEPLVIEYVPTDRIHVVQPNAPTTTEFLVGEDAEQITHQDTDTALTLEKPIQTSYDLPIDMVKLAAINISFRAGINTLKSMNLDEESFQAAIGDLYKKYRRRLGLPV